MTSIPATAYADFLALAKPFARRMGAAVEVSSDEEAARQAFSDLARETLVATEEGWPTEQLFRLRKAFELAIHLGKPVEAHWHLLYTVFEGLRGTARCRPFSDAEPWRQVLEGAVDFLNATSFRHALIGESREQVVARTYKRLESQGYAYTLDAHGVRLAAGPLRRLCASVERRIARAGGLNVANAMLVLMSRTGRLEDGSLLHARTPSATDRRPRRAGTPWHYIYSLALKNCASLPSVRDPEPVAERMEELAIDLAAALDVEPHNIYENMSLSPFGIERVIAETAIYDELFALPQWQPLAAQRLVPVWLTCLEAAGCAMPVLAREEWTAFGLSLLAASQPNAIVPIAPAGLRSAALSVPRAEIALAALSQPAQTVNAAYFTPFDTAARTSTWRPVISTPDRRFHLQPTAVAARAFCERLYALMREGGDPDLENKVGKALELTVVGILDSFGSAPTFVNRFYAGDGKGDTREVDIVLETDDRIFFIECTKKPLTSAARGGSTLAALRDLEGSLLKLIQQLARHEASLRSRGSLVFDDGRTLELRGRPVEKIGINLFDHGSLQSRDFTIAFIQALAGVRLNATSPEAAAVANAVNRRLARIGESFETITRAQSPTSQPALARFAMSTWWLSVDQLTYVLLKGGDDLWEGLRGVRHMSSRSGDLVHEMRRVRTLNEAGKTMLTFAQSQDNRVLI